MRNCLATDIINGNSTTRSASYFLTFQVPVETLSHNLKELVHYSRYDLITVVTLDDKPAK